VASFLNKKFLFLVEVEVGHGGWAEVSTWLGLAAARHTLELEKELTTNSGVGKEGAKRSPLHVHSCSVCQWSAS
jgi:hypothetical protein